MARPELLRNLAVVLGALVLVEDHQPDRRPRGRALEYTGQYLHLIRFAALGGVARRARTTAVRSGWISASDSAMPGGQPSTMQPIAIPWLSPNEVTVKSFPMVFPDMAAILQLARRAPTPTGRKIPLPLPEWQTRSRGDGRPPAAGARRKTVSQVDNIDTLPSVVEIFRFLPDGTAGRGGKPQTNDAHLVFPTVQHLQQDRWLSHRHPGQSWQCCRLPPPPSARQCGLEARFIYDLAAAIDRTGEVQVQLWGPPGHLPVT